MNNDKTNEEWADLVRAQIAQIDALTLALSEARNATSAPVDLSGLKNPYTGQRCLSLYSVGWERCMSEVRALLAASPAPTAPTVRQLAAQLDSDEKWTIAEQKAFAPFLARFPNECSQGIQSLGSAWKHGIAYANSLAAPQQHAQAALSDEPAWISVKDALPKIEQSVGMHSTRVHVLAVADYDGIVSQMSFIPESSPQWRYLDGRPRRFGPTHWMPLPVFDTASHQPAAAPDVAQCQLVYAEAPQQGGELLQDERKAFEAWMRDECGADDDMLKRPHEGRYFGYPDYSVERGES
jgi:hypothetical protein